MEENSKRNATDLLFMAVCSEDIEPDLGGEDVDFGNYPSLEAALNHLLDIRDTRKAIKAVFSNEVLEISYDFNTRTIRGKLNYEDLNLSFAAPCIMQEDFELSN